MARKRHSDDDILKLLREIELKLSAGEDVASACRGVGIVVTNLPMEREWVSGFYNRRGTAEQHIREGKYAIRWTRLSCRRFRDNEVQLQLHALAYNLAVFLSHVGLPEPMADWSLTSLQLRASPDQSASYPAAAK